MRDPGRLLKAKSLAVIGGGAWCEAIIEAARRIGFQGDIFPVHPLGKKIAGIASLTRLSDWDGPIDAAFIGVNRQATIGIIEELAALGAGGAVCFASGFSEAAAEDAAGTDLQADLVRAAGEMPILGPNCYGFVNALDRVAVWPDQHGMAPVERGVAILTQSSNIAINLTMQDRSLPLAYMVTCGNQAQTTQAQIARALLDDPRVTAIGLHIEGFGNTRQWHDLAREAAARGIPMVALKVGVSDQAQQATISHTASLAGSDAGAGALLSRLGIARAHDLPAFLEALKLLHHVGRLDAPTLSAISCSGGEASLIADTAASTGLTFPPLTGTQRGALGAALGPKVALANPLDYHTYIWRDAAAMTAAWMPMAADHIGLTIAIVDYPHTDPADWDCATQAALAVRAQTGRPIAVAASLPELMPADVAATLTAGGVVPLYGLREAVEAARIAAFEADLPEIPPLPGGALRGGVTLTEAEAKAALAAHGLDLPRRTESIRGSLAAAVDGLQEPFALKGVGLAHKSEAGAVRLGLRAEELDAVAAEMPGTQFLAEEMIQGGVAELLVGVTRDPAHGLLLTLGAGGVWTEVWQDSTSLLLPVTGPDVLDALNRLKIARVLDGFRGQPPADRGAVVAAVMAVQNYVMANHETLQEVEINPLICTPTRAVAVDALIRKE